MFKFIKKIFAALRNFFRAEPITATATIAGAVGAIVLAPSLATAFLVSIPAMCIVITISVVSALGRILWNYRQ